jgi:hypothetical protein
VRDGSYDQSLILHNNAGPLGTAASLHAAKPNGPAIPNGTLLEAPWVYREAETDVVWPYPEVVDGYALPLEGPGLGIAFDKALMVQLLGSTLTVWRRPVPGIFCAHLSVGVGLTAIGNCIEYNLWKGYHFQKRGRTCWT